MGKISARLENLSYSLNNEYLDQVSLYCSIVVTFFGAKIFGTSRRKSRTLSLPTHSVDIQTRCSFFIFEHSVQPKSTKDFIYYYRFSRRENRSTIFAPSLRQSLVELGPVIRTPVSANPGLNFNPGFPIFLSKALSGIIFSIPFRVSNHQIVGKEN